MRLFTLPCSLFTSCKKGALLHTSILRKKRMDPGQRLRRFRDDGLPGASSSRKFRGIAEGIVRDPCIYATTPKKGGHRALRGGRISQSGFSLMELFFVLAIVGIMLTATIMYFSSLSRSQAITSALQEVRAIIQAGAGYINLHANYDEFNVAVVKKTNLIEPKYNFTFAASGDAKAPTLLALPWTDEAQGAAGVTIISGEQYCEDYPTYCKQYCEDYPTYCKDPLSTTTNIKIFMPSQQYVLRFTSVPAWACQTLSQEMKLLAVQLTYCNADNSTETVQLDFALPKL